MRVRCNEIDGSGRWLYTVVGCKHDKPKAGRPSYTMSITDEENVVFEIEAEINQDFAGDEGITIEEYLANGSGYTVEAGDVKLCPCLKGTAKTTAGTTSTDRRSPMRSGPTRDQMIDWLRRNGYTGPTSMTKQDLYTKVYLPLQSKEEGK